MDDVNFRKIFWPVLVALLVWTIIVLIAVRIYVGYVADQISDTVDFSTSPDPAATVLSDGCKQAIDDRPTDGDESVACMFDSQAEIETYKQETGN